MIFCDIWIDFSTLVILKWWMATRAKYTRAKDNEVNNEPKLDTDILMKFSPSYGKLTLIQASIYHEPLLSFSANPRHSSPSKQLKKSWTRLFGLRRFWEEKSKCCTWPWMWPRRKLLMFGSLKKKGSLQLGNKDSWLFLRLLFPRQQLQKSRNTPAITFLLLVNMTSSPKSLGKREKRKEHSAGIVALRNQAKGGNEENLVNTEEIVRKDLAAEIDSKAVREEEKEDVEETPDND